MTQTEAIKRYVLDTLGMDAVGIASVEALDDERAGHRPEDILPGAKAVVVFLKHIPDGIYQAGNVTVEVDSAGYRNGHEGDAGAGQDRTESNRLRKPEPCRNDGHEDVSCGLGLQKGAV